VDRPLPDPETLAFARYRLEGLPAHVDESYLTGAGQRVLSHHAAGVFVIEVRAAPEDAPFSGPVPDELKEYLAPTAEAQSEAPEIRALAVKAGRGEPDPWQRALLLRAWVEENIEGDLDTGFGSAMDTLRSGHGDCTEHAVLLAALARAAGIPARTVMGVVYVAEENKFIRHMWNEVWAGQWRAIDSAFGGPRVSAARIRLGEHSLALTADRRTGLAGMLVFVAQLKIVVEEAGPPPAPAATSP
jgi:transglutaminase-like putative cysteine protease